VEDPQTGVLVSLISFLESRLKIIIIRGATGTDEPWPAEKPPLAGRLKKRDLKFNRTSCSYLRFLAKVVLLKAVHPLKIYTTKLHDTTLTGGSFSSTSEVWTAAILQ
jgi:hypothetical protein